MAIKSDNPMIAALRIEVQTSFGRKLCVHSDFLQLMDDIQRLTKQHISETTLERVWNYSTRGYSTVSLRTLDLLALYASHDNWDAFCRHIQSSRPSESDFFDSDLINSSDLDVGQLLRISWLPDRTCLIRYLGQNRFEAIECHNSTMRPGDTFSCLSFQLHKPLIMENFRKANDHTASTTQRYLVGSRNGLTALVKL